MSRRAKRIITFFRSFWHSGVFLYRCFMAVAVPVYRFLDKYFNLFSKDYILRFWK